MTAFDTTTNTVSTTFTNAYGTIDLLPSGDVQKVRGFARTSGWRYFEVYVDDNGGDSTRLFAGMETPPFPAGSPNYLVGGANTEAGISGAVFNPAYPYSPGTISLTCCTGDTFMFAVDMDGNGRLHDGSTPVGTLTDGSGNVLTKFICEVGKNGVWGGTYLGSFAWPSHGYPMRSAPWVARDSTSASYARLSLRVETLSFAYSIPSGMVAWGDGPEGGGSISASTIAIAWDPATIGSDQTLTNSNFQHNLVSAGSTLSAVSVKSTAFQLTGKRVVEFWGFHNKTASQTVSHTGSGGAIEQIQYNIGLCDASMTSISWSAFATQDQIMWFDNATRRGDSKASSMTQLQTYVGGRKFMGHEILYIDFDTSRIWERRGLSAANTLTKGNWAGRTISHSDGPDPYAGRDGMTFTASGSMRVIASCNKNYTAGHWIYMNVGQTAFETFPLLPGWTSLDGSRMATGVGSVWDTSAMPSSVSVCFSGLGVRSYDRTSDLVLVRNTTTKSAGKWFFEIFTDQENTGASIDGLIGLVSPDVSTLTANAIDSLGSVGLFMSPGGSVNANRTQNSHRIRYGVTTSFTQSMTMTTISVPGGSNAWYACAVDFDLGHIWFGSWNPNRRKIAWAQGADPATNTNPDMTFTAGTQMRIGIEPCNTVVGGAKGWRYLVAETANVIDLPSGFTPWNGTTAGSITATPSGTVCTSASGTIGGRVLWPYGVQT